MRKLIKNIYAYVIKMFSYAYSYVLYKFVLRPFINISQIKNDLNTH